jgi:ubiquinone/menaquinone biosynthesis C-methylase UbiE
VITHADRYGYPAQAVTCNRCGLTALAPRMTADAYGHFYEGVYRPLVSAFHGRLIDARTIQAEQREYADHMAALAEPYLTGRGRTSLLDVGGSTGIVSAHFARRFGIDATVIDPAPAEIEEARAAGVETIQGFVEDWDPQGRTFDVIGMFQTIDHLLDIAGTLQKLRRIIDRNGILIVDIVDFRAAYLRNWSVEQAIKIDHPYYLTETTAEAMLARAGFVVARRSYSPDHLHVAYVCRPAAPAGDALPAAQTVDALFRELRFVQNAPRARTAP